MLILGLDNWTYTMFKSTVIIRKHNLLCESNDKIENNQIITQRSMKQDLWQAVGGGPLDLVVWVLLIALY